MVKCHREIQITEEVLVELDLYSLTTHEEKYMNRHQTQGQKVHVLVMPNIPNSSNRGAKNTRGTSIHCHVHVLSGIALSVEHRGAASLTSVLQE
jgi:hypothetical protein